MSGGNGDDKIDGSPLGEKLFGSEYRTKVGVSIHRSYGKIGSSVGSYVEIGNDKLGVIHWEGSHLVQMVDIP